MKGWPPLTFAPRRLEGGRIPRVLVAAVISVSVATAAGPVAAGPGARSASALAPVGGVWRSGHPPLLASARIDGQRRLVVTYSAPDGVTYGGKLYLDNDPRDAQPVPSDPKYGPIMYCNNKYICLGRWILSPTPDTGPFTYTTEPLSAERFPAGTYWVQVDTTNEDPYPSTRQEEFSNIATIQVPAKGGGGNTGGGGGGGGGGGQTGGGLTTSSVRGNATVVHKDGSRGQAAAVGKLAVGDTVSTSGRSAKIGFANGNAIALDKNSSVTLTGATSQQLTVKQSRGGVWYSAVKIPHFTIKTALLSIAGDDTASMTVETTPQMTRVRVYQSKSGVELAGSGLILTKGFELVARPGQEPTRERFTPPKNPWWK